MIQIIGLLLCFYMIVKGFEFVFMALASSNEDKTFLNIFAVVMLFGCGAIAVFFGWLIIAQGNATPSR